MNILNTYTVSTTDKLDLGLKPNEPYFMIKEQEKTRGGKPTGKDCIEIHYAYDPNLLTDGESVSK